VLLAGSAAARHGVHEALAAIDGIEDATLWVRPGEGMEPRDLLSRNRVRVAPSELHARVQNADVVLAPAWCESYPPEVPLAAAMGIPVIATDRAAGWVDLDRAGACVSRGDVGAIRAAIESLS
jgi:hypothetical protein